MKNKYLSFLLIFILFFIFTGCVNKIPEPTIDNHEDKVKILEPIKGYYQNRVGKSKNLFLNNYEYGIQYTLMKWPNNNYKTICFLNKICLIDTMNKGYFTHSSVLGREELFKLTKPAKYKILKKISTIEFISNPKIYNDENRKKGLQIIYLPSLNTISHKEVGESIFEKINQFNFNTYRVPINQEVSLHPIDEYGEKDNIKLKFDKNYTLMKWPEKDYKTICQDNFCLIDKNNNNSFTHYAIEEESKLYLLDQAIKYKAIENIKYTEDSFKYQALYQGKVANKIRISFREFKDDMLRVAFTQDIEYELNANKPTIIGFKGLRIKIINATNLNITYSVIKDYN